MPQAQRLSTRESRSHVLTALTSIRFLAVLHIFLFHLYAAHRSGPSEIRFAAFDTLPETWLRVVSHGSYSTSLFFLLSGFVLAYLYIGRDGRLTIGMREFLIARVTRIYPIHLLALLLVLPVPLVMMRDQPFDMLASGIASALLVQAWFPTYAVTWNFPTWALSTVVFFYIAFPWVAALLRRLSRPQLAWLLATSPLISLAPTLVFLAAGGEERFPPFGFWNELLMRLPLLWLPHFVMGVLLSRVLGIRRDSDDWRDSEARSLSWGDAAFAALCVLLVIDPTVSLGGRTFTLPPFVMRHGALAPLYLVIVADLARGRGLLARALDRPWLETLGNASFSIFMLQLPVMLTITIASHLGLLADPTAQLLATIGLCLAVSVLSARRFEAPIAQRLRRRWMGTTAAAPGFARDEAVRSPGEADSGNVPEAFQDPPVGLGGRGR